ncbi:hypothetical protein NC651_023412 [Populus alba x Populus x berolinensis]|nr:hypothetical protein NC651_023412 [Populus alba x Populus x berolinensis]
MTASSADIKQGFKRAFAAPWPEKLRYQSVGFTGAAGFILAFLWFFLFGFALVAHHCFKWRINIKDKGSSRSQRISLIMLILFTCAAAIGCILLCVGQDDFHVECDLNAAADTLTEKTSENAGKIVKVFNAVYVSESLAVSFDYCGSVMLILALLGFLLSILGHQHAIHIFVVSGWLLVAVTFILCGVFILLNNAISDTCLAMEEWVENPHAASALSSILPCVDQRTTNNTLVQSKEVITDIVNVVNTYIYTFANANPSQTEFNYYNQSGPSMPPLCYPLTLFIKIVNASPRSVYGKCICVLDHFPSLLVIISHEQVWQNYTCMVSSSGLCTTVGRVIPDIYRQLVAAVNESYALEYYTPVLLSLQDCKFVRDTFLEITSSHCPPLEHYLKIVNAGLGLISVGVLLCLVLWILYANCPLMEEVFAKISSPIKCSRGCAGVKIGSSSSGKNDASLSITSVV